MRQSPEPYHGAKAGILPVFDPLGDYAPALGPCLRLNLRSSRK